MCFGAGTKVSRFYCKNISEGELSLDKTQSHHLARVMRLSEGERIELFDGNGTVAHAVIVKVKRGGAAVMAEHVQTKTPRETGRVIIAASVARGQRFDWLISKCTELGADHIAAVLFDRTVKQAGRRAAAERYSKLSIAATKQSGRLFLPKITGPADLQQTLNNLKEGYPDARLIFGSFSKCAKPIGELQSNDKDTIAFIGPEGGMTTEEESLLKDHNAQEVKLTETTLRIETAAITFAAILCTSRKTE